MTEMFALICPNCGSDLKVTAQVDRFACASCGQDLLVQRKGSTVWAKPMMEAAQRAGDGMTRQASEYAIRRLRKEIPELEQKAYSEELRKTIIQTVIRNHAELQGVEEEMNAARKNSNNVVLVAAGMGFLAILFFMISSGSSSGPGPFILIPLLGLLATLPFASAADNKKKKILRRLTPLRQAEQENLKRFGLKTYLDADFEQALAQAEESMAEAHGELQQARQELDRHLSNVG